MIFSFRRVASSQPAYGNESMHRWPAIHRTSGIKAIVVIGEHISYHLFQHKGNDSVETHNAYSAGQLGKRPYQSKARPIIPAVHPIHRVKELPLCCGVPSWPESQDTELSFPVVLEYYAQAILESACDRASGGDSPWHVRKDIESPSDSLVHVYKES